MSTDGAEVSQVGMICDYKEDRRVAAEATRINRYI